MLNGTPNPLRDAGVIAQQSGELLVLFQMESGRYFSLNECGCRIWGFCDGTHSADEIAGLVAEEYDSPAGVREDVFALLVELSGKGLLTAK